MKLSFIKMSIATLAVVLVAGAAIAQHRGGPRGGGDFFGGSMFGFFSDYLDLTDAQQAQIKDMFAKEKPTMEPLFKQEMQSRKDMMQLIRNRLAEEGGVRRYLDSLRKRAYVSIRLDQAPTGTGSSQR